MWKICLTQNRNKPLIKDLQFWPNNYETWWRRLKLISISARSAKNCGFFIIECKDYLVSPGIFSKTYINTFIPPTQYNVFWKQNFNYLPCTTITHLMHNYTIGLVRYFGKNLYIYQINQVCLYEIIINLFVLFFCVNYQIKFLYIQNKNKLIWYIIFPKVDDKAKYF